MRLSTAMAALTLFFPITAQSVSAAGESRLVNIARGRPYTLSKPNYRHSTDAGDATQLTDGVYSKGHFWTQKTTVGWSGGQSRSITIDLGTVEPIAGVAFSTAAGAAEVAWPCELWVFTSDDNAHWHFAGDLLDLSAEVGLPPTKGYATHVFRTTRLRTHGRYVQIVAMPDGSYLFTDEIEVYRGEAAWLREPRRGDPVVSVDDHVATQRFNGLIKAQLRRDLDAVRRDVERPGLDEAGQQAFRARIEDMTRRITAMPAVRRE